MYRVEFADEQQILRFKEFIGRCGASSAHELFEYSMTLLDWAVREREKGREIASVDRGEMHVQFLHLSLLDRIPPTNKDGAVPKFTVIDGGKED